MTSNSEVFENGKVLGHKMHQENGSLYINFKLYYGRSLGDQRTHKMHAAQELSPTLTHKLSKSLFPLLPLQENLSLLFSGYKSKWFWVRSLVIKLYRYPFYSDMGMCASN